MTVVALTPPIPRKYDALPTKYWLDRDGRRNSKVEPTRRHKIMILFFVLLCCLAIPLVASAAFRAVRTGKARITPLSRTTGAWRVDEALNKYADESLTQPKGIPMLWTIIVILVVLWLLGFIGHVGGSLIHLLLVVAVVVLIINLIQGRRGL